MFGSMVVKLNSTPAGNEVPAERIAGNTGAPACAADRMTFNWLVLVTFVVLPLESSAVARKGDMFRHVFRRDVELHTLRPRLSGIPAAADFAFEGVLQK